jgi:hypothetical protein
MKMNKITDQIYEFIDSRFEDNMFEFDEEPDYVEIVEEEKSVDISVLEFFSMLKIGLGNLSVEEAEEIGLF